MQPLREVIIEKHWRGVTTRAVCDFFWDEVNKYDSKEVSDFSDSKYLIPPDRMHN